MTWLNAGLIRVHHDLDAVAKLRADRFDNPEVIARIIVVEAIADEFAAKLAVADTPGCAWAMARFGQGGVVPPGRMSDVLGPLPVAGIFAVGPNSGVSSIATRVRVDSYTNVHAVAELDDGKLYVVATYVKASGGCSAPAAKNADEAVANLGQMRLRQFTATDPAPASRPREAQIMVRHPNNSGLQMDQVTRLYIPAFFVNELHIWQDDTLVLAMQGGISISEDPNIRFSYVPNGAKHIRVEAKDTDGHVFQNEWNVDNSGM